MGVVPLLRVVPTLLGWLYSERKEKNGDEQFTKKKMNAPIGQLEDFSLMSRCE